MPRRLGRIKVRRDFLRVAEARRKFVSPSLILQILEASDPELAGRHAEGRRVGFTASKKVGNAVARNRAKRRLRAAIAQVAADRALPNHDYVVIARNTTKNRRFSQLVGDLEAGLKRLKVWRQDDQS